MFIKRAPLHFIFDPLLTSPLYYSDQNNQFQWNTRQGRAGLYKRLVQGVKYIRGPNYHHFSRIIVTFSIIYHVFRQKVKVWKAINVYVYVLKYHSRVHEETNWLPFDSSKNSIFRLNFKLNLSLNVFLIKWIKVKYGFTTPIIFYFIQIEKVSKNCWKTQSF